MPNVPTMMSPIVKDSKPTGSRFFVERNVKKAGNSSCDSKKVNKSRKINKAVASQKKTKPSSRYALLEKLLSPGLSRRMRFRLSKLIDVNNYSPIHPCKLDVFSSPAVKVSHFMNVKTRLRVRKCSLQKLK